MLHRLLFLLAVTCAAAFANNTCTLTYSSARPSFSTSLASDWSNCGGVKPQSGDNIILGGGTGTFTLDVDMVFGTGNAPVYGYPAYVTGSAGGSTTCAGTMPTLGGTTVGFAATIACHVVSGACTPYINNQHAYSSTSGVTTNIASACTGGTPTWTVNWVTGGGTAAIFVSPTIGIKIAAHITVQGDVLYTATFGFTGDFLVFSNGGRLTVDTSASPTNVNRYLLSSKGGESGASLRTYRSDGTCPVNRSGCVIDTVAGGYGSSWAFDSESCCAGGPHIDFENMTISGWGNVQQYAFDQAGTLDLKLINDHFNGFSSMALNAQTGSNNILDIENCTFTGSTPTNQRGELIFLTLGATWDGTGTRKIMNNSFDALPWTTTSSAGVTFSGNVFSTNQVLYTNHSTNPWTAFSNNAIFLKNFVQSTIVGNGSEDHDIIWLLDPSASNWHVTNDGFATATYSYNIYGITGTWTGDAGEIAPIPGTGVTVNFLNNFILPGSDMRSWAEPGGTAEGGGGTYVEDHNYWAADFGSTAFGFLDTDEVNASHTGVLTSLRCNTMDSPLGHAAVFMKIQDIGATPTCTDPSTAANADYNWGVGSGDVNSSCAGCTGQSNGYAAKWTTGIPGSHDHAYPGGMDINRRPETFPHYYLRYTPTAGTYSTSNDYALGATVEDQQSSAYNNAITTWTCVAAAGCSHTTAPRPGTATGYTAYWEPYSLTWLKLHQGDRDLIADGSLVVFGVNEDTACTAANPCDAITALRHWIYRGYVNSNPQFWGACAMDGKSIGPGEEPLVRRMPAAVAIN